MNRMKYIMKPYRMVYGIICNSIWYVMVYNMGWQTMVLLPVFVNKVLLERNNAHSFIYHL